MKGTLAMLFFWLAISYCNSQILNPVSSDALLLSKGDFEITAGYSSIGFAYDGQFEEFLNGLDLQIGYGVSERVNVIARYQTAWFAGEMSELDAQNFLFVGPDIQLKKDRISFYLPVGTQFSRSNNNSSFEISPALKFSIPLSKKVYINPSLELGFAFCDYCSDKPYLSVNLAMGVRPIDVLSFFAEYDLVYSFEEFGDGYTYIINGGVAFAITRKD